MSNLRGSRCAFSDDFHADKTHPLCGTLVRRLSGGNKLTAARKNKGNRDYDADFGLNLCLNEMPPIEPPLKGPDLRRATSVPFKLSYKDSTKFDAQNPLHRLKKASIKREMHCFMAEFMLWIRCLAPAVRSIDATQLMPQPLAVKEAAAELAQQQECVYFNAAFNTWAATLCCKDPLPPTTAAAVRIAILAQFPGVAAVDIATGMANNGFVEQTVKRHRRAYRAYCKESKPYSLA